MLQCIKKKRIQGDNQSCHFPEKSDVDEIESTGRGTDLRQVAALMLQPRRNTVSLFHYIWQIWLFGGKWQEHLCICVCVYTHILLLLSHFSHVRLCVTPSLGFSRQEHSSGLPFPSPMHKSEKWKWSHSVMSDSSRPHGLQPTRLLRPWDFPGKSTGVGCHIYKYT